MHRVSSRVQIHTLEGCPTLKTGSITIQGRSRAAERTGFVLLEPKILLDCGLGTYIQPCAALMTHTHADHSFHIVSIAMGQPKKFPVYFPREAEFAINQFIQATSDLLNCRQESDPPIPQEHCLILTPAPLEPFQLHDTIYARAVPLSHTVPTVGYILFHRRLKLLPHLIGTPAQQLRRMRLAGEAVDHAVDVPFLAYLCDTHIDAVLDLFSASDAPPAPVVMVECSFLTEDMRELADKKRHVDWPRLRPLVERFDQVQFVLIHFSMRYTDEDVKRVFEGCALQNVFLWLDGGVWAPAKQQVVTQL